MFAPLIGLLDLMHVCYICFHFLNSARPRFGGPIPIKFSAWPSWAEAWINVTMAFTLGVPFIAWQMSHPLWLPRNPQKWHNYDIYKLHIPIIYHNICMHIYIYIHTHWLAEFLYIHVNSHFVVHNMRTWSFLHVLVHQGEVVAYRPELPPQLTVEAPPCRQVEVQELCRLAGWAMMGVWWVRHQWFIAEPVGLMIFQNLVGGDWNMAGLWLSHHIGDFIIPTDEVIFFQEGLKPPTRNMSDWIWMNLAINQILWKL